MNPLQRLIEKYFHTPGTWNKTLDSSVLDWTFKLFNLVFFLGAHTDIKSQENNGKLILNWNHVSIVALIMTMAWHLATVWGLMSAFGLEKLGSMKIFSLTWIQTLIFWGVWLLTGIILVTHRKRKLFLHKDEIILQKSTLIPRRINIQAKELKQIISISRYESHEDSATAHTLSVHIFLKPHDRLRKKIGSFSEKNTAIMEKALKSYFPHVSWEKR